MKISHKKLCNGFIILLEMWVCRSKQIKMCSIKKLKLISKEFRRKNTDFLSNISMKILKRGIQDHPEWKVKDFWTLLIRKFFIKVAKIDKKLEEMLNFDPERIVSSLNGQLMAWKWWKLDKSRKKIVWRMTQMMTDRRNLKQ